MRKLPEKVVIPKFILKDKQYNAILDFLSDKYEFCINSFVLSKHKGKTYATKINWDTTE